MKRVTLTFDNGPTPGVTDRVLDILARRGLRTTFFVVASKLDDPAALALAEAAHAAGHWIGNHTLTHTVALGDRPDHAYAQREIGDAQARLGALARPEKLFRPYGNDGLIGPHLLSAAALDILLAGRYRGVLWTSVPGDWKDAGGWVETCLAHVAAQDWTVTVLHDIPGACLDRLPDLLDRLERLGVRFEQEIPDSVVLTSGGRTVSLDASYIADAGSR